MRRPPRPLLLGAAGTGAGRLATLVVKLAPSFGYDMSSGGPVRLIYFVALLLFVSSALIGRVSLNEVVRGVLGWSAILIVVIGAYAYRTELVGVGGRLLGVLVPGMPISGQLDRRKQRQRGDHAQWRRPFRRTVPGLTACPCRCLSIPVPAW